MVLQKRIIINILTEFDEDKIKFILNKQTKNNSDGKSVVLRRDFRNPYNIKLVQHFFVISALIGTI